MLFKDNRNPHEVFILVDGIDEEAKSRLGRFWPKKGTVDAVSKIVTLFPQFNSNPS